jgi:hypothetical protein
MSKSGKGGRLGKSRNKPHIPKHTGKHKDTAIIFHGAKVKIG